ncbi:MAG TPA: isoleucine--tRNA ligase [Candidatus Brocadiia bacterium]
MNYKDTINLPATTFSMKADLLHKEPEILKRWDKEDLYGQIRKARAGAKKYILHDGPPYPTGDLHIGTGLNKILKDIIVRFYTMRGYDAPFIPGWDCHGLPIEHRVMQELGEEAKKISKTEIRKKCKKYAEKFVKLQKLQFKGLGVSGDWEHPYLTFDPKYEAGIIDIFGELVERGYVYRSLKPIHWCMQCQTALAEAELEYGDETSPSIYVNFKIKDDISNLFNGINRDSANILIWTTTPWTLPANLAIALHPDIEYTAVRYINPKTSRKEVTILASGLVDTVMARTGTHSFERLGKAQGRQLEGKKYQHVFFDREGALVLADYVSISDGTGCVHTAPGHGLEDHITGLKYNLPMLSPVDASGVFTEDAGEFSGLHIKKGNETITRKLEELGALLHLGNVSHSYPHCWRCKEPVIFRATEQWFIDLEHNNLREVVLKEIKRTRWIPDWGETRITNMVAARPDWCISRQRSWGVPIPAFYCIKCNEVLLSAKVVYHVRDVFEKHGADSWFYKDASEFLPEGTKCAKCGSTGFRKESDIFDVWFESGSSHHAVVHKRQELSFPADMYLEGTDQHRGWFQLSLLPSVGAWGCAPFKTVLTHGFVVDEKGEKMSKSAGNFISVEDALKEFGGDIIRLWTSSIDYTNDMNVSRDLINWMSDSYRRIRNTFRYLLGNLCDFNPSKHTIAYDKLWEIDRWALHKTHELTSEVTSAYESLQFHKVFHTIHNFCAVDMSAFYLDILKDRLYTFTKDSLERRAAQMTLYQILLTLVKLLAPLTVFTSEEVWCAIEHKDEDVPSVHLATWPIPTEEWKNEGLGIRWDRIVKVRVEVARELEKMRAAKLIGKSLEAEVNLYTDNEDLYEFLKSFENDLPMIFIVSDVSVTKGTSPDSVQGEEIKELWIKTYVSKNQKCERCWNYFKTVGRNPAHPTLCTRCVDAIEAIITRKQNV